MTPYGLKDFSTLLQREWFLLRSIVGLNNLNLRLCQPIKFVDELVNLAVGGFDLALKTPERIASPFRSSRGSQFCSVGVEIVIQGS